MDALGGIRILDLTWGVAGPAGVLLLAEHGADVVKVEPPGGSPYRDHPGYRVWDRSRRSVTLDLKSPEGKDRFLDLLAGTDVLVESFSPGVMARLGLDYHSLEERFPQLVYMSVPAYPTDSRNTSRAGWDALVQARSGQQWEQPGWRAGPIFLPSPMPSMGALFLVPAGILAALHAREQTGRGQQVETSLYQGVLAFTTMLWVHAERNQNTLQSMMAKTYPPGLHQPEVIACADGWIMSPVATQKKGVSIHDVIGAPLDTPDIYGAMKEAYKSWKREELLDRLHDDLFQAELILPTRDTLRHPQIVANEMAVEVEDPEVGTTTQVGIPFKLSATPGRVRGGRPRPGQHNDEVFAEPRPAPAVTAKAPDHHHALEGIRVLDFGRAFAGPFAPMVLAGLGAEVIKVATTDAGPMAAMMANSSVWLGCEQGKRSIHVNLKDPEGRRIVHELVARADVVHHNMTMGVPERLGIDYETLRQVKPDLIYCNTYMYGPTGPLAHLGGQDSLAQAASGLEWEAGPAEEGNDPLWYRFGHGDTSNALSSVVGVLIALAHRDRTGEGQSVWTSLLNGATYLNSEVHLTPDGPADPPRMDKGQHGFGALYRLYETQSGWLQVAAPKAGHWPALCEAVGRPDLEADERFATAEDRHANRAELESLLEGVFATRTALQWRRALDAAGVPSEVSADTVDGEHVLFDDENLHLGLVTEQEHASLGLLRQVGALIRFGDTPGRVAGPPPLSGQHTREVMEWLGYDGPAVDDLVTRGIVG